MKLSLIEKSNFYFNRFPIVDYHLKGVDRPTLDFIHRWAFRKHIKENAASYSKWIIRDEDSIFSIAQTIYGSQHHFWIIMMMNDMIDPIFDWPLDNRDLIEYVKKKYGAENIYEPHHLEAVGAEGNDDINVLPSGTIVSNNYTADKVTVSNFDYESRLNEEKRNIKLLLPEYLETVLREKSEILSSNFNRN
jgi:hypothetical protein